MPSSLGPLEPKRFLLGHHKKEARRRKLSPWDVKEIRRYARGEGFGLTRTAQVHALRAGGYHGVSSSALEDVITNQSFFDPSYSKDIPLPSLERDLAPFLALPGWMLTVILFLLVVGEGRTR